MERRREQSLCFNCLEKFFKGHRCENPATLLIICEYFLVEEEPEPPDTEPYESMNPQNLLVPPDISLHALAGHSSLHTLRLTSYIRNSPVQIFIDSGSTHNFIQEDLVSRLRHPLDSTYSFPVTVENGHSLQCSGCARKFR